MKISLRLGKKSSLALYVIAILFIAFFAAIGSSLFNQKNKASALSATDFNAGRIIDDSIFYNKDAMSVQQIQNFLDTLIPYCDTWHPGSFVDGAGQTVWAPYVCLNNYHENPDTGETSFEKGGGSFAGGLSAAQIIYNAAQTYNINPQVLLVMLKKESLGPLTVDNWPTKYQYRYAMGYGCPDSGPGNTANCDNEQAGFYKQMMKAAWQLNYYKEHPNDYRYHIGWNDIQYSPNLACGTKRVYIENIATLSLYIYTPYTPNNAALANYPGTADCGAYGNRNFFMFFSEWFGNTTGFTVKGAILERYNQLGGIDSSLGKPVDNEYCSTKGCFQQFENGFIIGNGRTGYWESSKAIRTRYSKLGYESGKLGFPVGAEYSTVNGGTFQQFENGFIIGKSSTGYWESLGSIRSRYSKLGYESGKLGFPVGPEFSTTRGGVFQQYEKGYIIGKGSTGYWENSTAIRTRYSKLGYESGKLGFPVGPEVSTISSGVFQQFENGYIIGKQSTGYWESLGSIRSRYSKLGYESGKLGFPVGPEFTTIRGGVFQQYENGYIIGKGNTGYWENLGAIRKIYGTLNYEHGALGFPTSGEIEIQSGSGYYQNYESGHIYDRGNGTYTYKLGSGFVSQ